MYVGQKRYSVHWILQVQTKLIKKILENNDTNKYLLHFHFNSILGGNSKVMILQFLTFCIYLFHAST